MKKRLKPICAAIVLLGCGLAHGAAFAMDVFGDAAEAADAVSGSVSASASASTETKRNLRIQTETMQHAQSMDWAISSKISEAFATAFSGHGERAVKNAPYSAEVVTEHVQTLADGNQLSKQSKSMAYRDAAGRTRQEIRDDKGELNVIHIYDPTDGTRYIVSPSSKSVNKIVIDKEMTARIEAAMQRGEEARKRGEEARVRSEEARRRSDEARTKSDERRVQADERRAQAQERSRDARDRMAREGTVTVERGPNGEEIVTRRIEKVGADGKIEKREETVVKVIRMNDDGAEKAREFRFHMEPPARAVPPVPPVAGVAPVPPAPPAPPAPLAAEALVRMGPINMAFNDRAYRSKASTTELGSKDFDGVKASGKRTSYTIPANEMGNKNPIVVSSETWYSPELQVTVYSKHSDPRAGETVYRLANLKRSEQPANLFVAPEGFKVKETRIPHAPIMPKFPAPPAPAAAVSPAAPAAPAAPAR